MFSHVTVGTNDLKRSEIFYDALLSPLGLQQRKVSVDGGPKALCWFDGKEQLPRFYVYEPYDGKPASFGNGGMIAFEAKTIRAVDIAFEAAMKNGAKSEGEPGLRQHYGDGYYGAYLRDPDGNKIHITYRGDIR